MSGESMSFDEWMDKNHGGLFDMPHQRECFEAGAQSRQAEIDELQKRIDDAWNELDDRYSKQYIIEKIENILKGKENEN